MPGKNSIMSMSDSARAQARNLSGVVRTFADHVFFTDRDGRVLDASVEAGKRFQGGLVGRFIGDVLHLEAGDMNQLLGRFPPGQVHEIPAPSGQGTFAVRILSLPESCAPPGYVIVATDNRPIARLREKYKKRIGENIQALDNSIRLFGALFDGVRDAMLLLAEDHVVHAANPKAVELLEANEDGLIGREAQTLFQVEDRARILEKLNTLKDGGRWNARRTCLDAKGQPLPVETTLWRIDLQGVSFFHMALRDLTARARLEKGLRRKHAEVESMNLALRNVVRSLEQEKSDIREDVVREIRSDILPALDRMAREPSPELRNTLKQMIEGRIVELSNGGVNETTGSLSPLLLKLTPREIEVCKLIRMGSSTKDVAEFLNASFDTIQTHRKNIRRKLGLKGRAVSLYSFLHQQNVLD